MNSCDSQPGGEKPIEDKVLRQHILSLVIPLLRELNVSAGKALAEATYDTCAMGQPTTLMFLLTEDFDDLREALESSTAEFIGGADGVDGCDDGFYIVARPKAPSNKPFQIVVMRNGKLLNCIFKNGHMSFGNFSFYDEDEYQIWKLCSLSSDGAGSVARVSVAPEAPVSNVLDETSEAAVEAVSVAGGEKPGRLL